MYTPSTYSYPYPPPPNVPPSVLPPSSHSLRPWRLLKLQRLHTSRMRSHVPEHDLTSRLYRFLHSLSSSLRANLLSHNTRSVLVINAYPFIHLRCQEAVQNSFLHLFISPRLFLSIPSPITTVENLLSLGLAPSFPSPCPASDSIPSYPLSLLFLPYARGPSPPALSPPCPSITSLICSREVSPDSSDWSPPLEILVRSTKKM